MKKFMHFCRTDEIVQLKIKPNKQCIRGFDDIDNTQQLKPNLLCSGLTKSFS